MLRRLFVRARGLLGGKDATRPDRLKRQRKTMLGLEQFEERKLLTAPLKMDPGPALFTQRIQHLRMSSGLAPIVLEAKATAVDMAYAAKHVLFTPAGIYHVDPLTGETPTMRRQAGGANTRGVAENLHWGEPLSVVLAFDGWFNSPLHLENMTRQTASEFGLGWYHGGPGKKSYVVFTSAEKSSDSWLQGYSAGQIYDDKNGNGWPEATELLHATSIVATSHETGAQFQITPTYLGTYSLKLNPGVYTITANVPGRDPISGTVPVTRDNVWADFIAGQGVVLNGQGIKTVPPLSPLHVNPETIALSRGVPTLLDLTTNDETSTSGAVYVTAAYDENGKTLRIVDGKVEYTLPLGATGNGKVTYSVITDHGITGYGTATITEQKPVPPPGGGTPPPPVTPPPGTPPVVPPVPPEPPQAVILVQLQTWQKIQGRRRVNVTQVYVQTSTPAPVIISVVEAGRDRRFGTPDDRVVPVISAASKGSNGYLFTPPRGPLNTRRIRVVDPTTGKVLALSALGKAVRVAP